MVGKRPALTDDPDSTPQRQRWALDPVDVLSFLGLALLAGGLLGYDWRLAAVVCGFLILAAAVVGAWRAGHGGE